MATTQEEVSRKRRGRATKDTADADLGAEARLVDEEPDGQKRLDGMERLADPEIEAQAERVKDLENKRRKILAKEVEQRAILTKMMRDKKVTLYPLGGDLEGYVAEIETEPKAKIHKARKKDEDDE